MIHFPETATFQRLLAGILFCLLCITASGQNKINTYQSLFQTNQYLKYWTITLSHFSLSSFTYTRTINFENMILDDSLNNNDLSFRQTFGKLVSYSPDKQKYLDLNSGQIVFDTVYTNGKKEVNILADIDQYLTLGDYTAKKSTRLLFMGATSYMDEAEWISDNTFIVVGLNTEKESFSPFIYIGDIKKRQFYCYLTNNKDITRHSSYRSPKWNRLKGIKF